jgi:hypothetical protein
MAVGYSLHFMCVRQLAVKTSCVDERLVRICSDWQLIERRV